MHRGDTRRGADRPTPVIPAMATSQEAVDYGLVDSIISDRLGGAA